MKNQLLSWAQILISLFCLVFALSLVKPKILAEAWAGADPLMLCLTFILMPPAILSRAYRWWYILRTRGVNVPLVTMGKVTFIGMALNVMLPGGMGDVARSYYGWALAGNKEAMLASAIVDKIVALVALCFLGAVCALLTGFPRICGVSILFGLPFLLVLAMPRVIPWRLVSYLFKRLLRKDFSRELLEQTFHLDRRAFAGSLLISLIGWGITNLMYYSACRAFTSEVSLAYVFAIAPLINLARAMPIAVSGLGSVDLLFVLLLRKVDVAESIGMMASVTIDMSLIILPGVVGALLLATCRTARLDLHTRSVSIDRSSG